MLGRLFERMAAPRAFASVAPIALVLSAGMLSITSMYRQYIFTSKVIRGVYDLAFLTVLRSAIKQARGLRQFPAGFSDGTIVLERFGPGKKHETVRLNDLNSAANADEVKAIASLAQDGQREIASMLSSRQWLEIKRRYGFHLVGINLDLVRPPSNAGIDYAEDFQRYKDRLEQLNEYFHLVADQSNLILDPQLDTYYLMYLTSSLLPSLIDVVAEARGVRVAIDTNNSGESIELGVLNVQSLDRAGVLLEFMLNDLNRAINIISFSAPEAHRSLQIDRLGLVDSIDRFMPVLLDRKGASSPVAVEHWNQSTELIALLERIQDKGVVVLRERLEARRLGIAAQMAMVLALLLSGCLLVYFINARLYGRLSSALGDLKVLANTDSLTKLLTRRSLPHLYYKAIAADSGEAEGLALCLLDIDFFKAYNDTYGHANGDRALIAVASFLKGSLLRKTDYAFRYGGEEFLLLFAASSERKMDYFLQGLRRGIEGLGIEHRANQIADHLTVSFGAVFIPANSIDVELDVALLQADRELYKVKNDSRNGVSFVALTSPMYSELKREIVDRPDRRLISSGGPC